MYKCPQCGSEPLSNNEQPQAGTHAYTTIFKCGTELDQAFSSPIDEYSVGVLCDGSVKRFVMPKLSAEAIKRFKEKYVELYK